VRGAIAYLSQSLRYLVAGRNVEPGDSFRSHDFLDAERNGIVPGVSFRFHDFREAQLEVSGHGSGFRSHDFYLAERAAGLTAPEMPQMSAVTTEVGGLTVTAGQIPVARIVAELPKGTALDVLRAILSGEAADEASVGEMVVYLQVDPQNFEALRQQLKILDESLMRDSIVQGTNLTVQQYNDAVDAIFDQLSTVRTADSKVGLEIGLVMPASVPNGFMARFLEALDKSHVAAIALNRDKIGIAQEAAPRKVLIENLKEVKKLRPVPTAVFDPQADQGILKDLLLRFQVDDNGVGGDDTLTRDLAQVIMLAAVINAAGVTQGKLKPQSTWDAVELKKEVVNQLAQFEMIQLDADGKFMIRAVLAKAWAQARAEARVAAAA
jgi:hypothetical protein